MMEHKEIRIMPNLPTEKVQGNYLRAQVEKMWDEKRKKRKRAQLAGQETVERLEAWLKKQKRK